jgi:hypothetical protein
MTYTVDIFSLRQSSSFTTYFGPEAQFFLFSDVRFDQTSNSGYYFLDSDEGVWNTGADRGGKNLGYRPRYKEVISRCRHSTRCRMCARRSC